MNDNEIKQAKEELDALQKDIIERKRELSKLNEEKEGWFQKRAEIGSRIASRIRDVKDKRDKRDELTAQVQEEKKERREYSQEIREKISEVKRLRDKRDKQRSNAGISGNPQQLKREIDGIEYKLETVPMPYQEERKLNRILKEKKKAYGKLEDTSELSEKIRTLSEEIDRLKEESDEVHEGLQEIAEESQEFHEEVIETSKAIDDLKEEEDAAYQKFSDLKDVYVEKREELQAVIDQAEDIRKKLSDAGEEVARVQRLNTKRHLKKQAAEVEEKVKNKETLTTEDLLAFQAGN